jgi:hypothetical protein
MTPTVIPARIRTSRPVKFTSRTVLQRYLVIKIYLGGRKGERQVTTGLSQHHDNKRDPSYVLGRMDGVRGRSQNAQFTSQSISVVRKISMRDGNEINIGR